ncbi:hypothetical protein SAMN06264364_12042 [Quadrisphaera granulorum]|uniref:Uncharacterized protein n=1 Tax=Quadrisphaera granulorum TaxID=317664 RepID=A0A316A4N1_9ACTN|nr:hypothetical protein [Quadrisphaera granulorum]PWJ51764.1 hypothetical protein BXY45_12042 [Quadrisphaera granulorum]SZE97711.1 hypothetical protein SAMN06264364_12042 [Quadrisphaera granulorum]
MTPARRATPSVRSALVAAGLAGLLALAGLAGLAPATAAVVLVSASLALGWPGLLLLPSPRGSAAVVGGAGALAALATGVTAALDGGREPLRALPAVLAVAVLGAFTHQMLRRDLRPRVVDGLGGAVTGLLLAGLASGWIAAAASPSAPAATSAVAAAVATASLACALPGPRPVTALVALAVGASAGAGGSMLAGAAAGGGALLGGVAAAVVVLVAMVLAPLAPASRALPSLGRAAAPVAACGAVVGLLGPLLL